MDIYVAYIEYDTGIGVMSDQLFFTSKEDAYAYLTRNYYDCKNVRIVKERVLTHEEVVNGI